MAEPSYAEAWRYIEAEATYGILHSTTQDECICEMVTAVLSREKASRDVIQSAAYNVMSRERTATTGVGKGVAVPHAKYFNEDCALGKVMKRARRRAYVGWFIAPKGIDWSALDSKPVYLICCILTNETDLYLMMMESVFKLITQDMFIKLALHSTTPEALRRVLVEARDRNIPPAAEAQRIYPSQPTK